MKRREFIAVIGGAVVAQMNTAHAQQSPMPLIGWLSSTTAEGLADRLQIFRERLGNEALSRVKISPSNIVGQTTTTTACRLWQPISSTDVSA